MLDDIDDLCRLLAQHIPATGRDEFHRELADLLHTRHPEPATTQVTGTA
jgi:hypothetical protein